MPAPEVSWYNATNDAVVAQYTIGTIDAGTTSPDTTLLIWNNRKPADTTGYATVSDMTNCTLTTKDSGAGNTGELVNDKWIEVRVDSMAEATFTAIGGTTTKAIKAEAQAAGVIRGTVNNADLNANKANYAKITLHANVPGVATAGNTSFFLRVAYQYV